MNTKKLAEIDQKMQSYYIVTHYPDGNSVIDRELQTIEDFDLTELENFDNQGKYKAIHLNNPKGRILYDSRKMQSGSIKGDKQSQLVKKSTNVYQDIEETFNRLESIVVGFEHSSIDKAILEDLKNLLTFLRKRVNFATTEV